MSNNDAPLSQPSTITEASATPPSNESVSPLVEVSRRPNPAERIGQIWAYRELLMNLIGKELKVRYKESVLGFAWSLLNPLLYLVVFSLVFSEILRVDVPVFGIFLLSGLLAWNLLVAGITDGTNSIVANTPLVQKVRFPREVLPLAAVGAAIVNFGLQLLVLLAGMAVLRHPPDLRYIPLLLAAFVVLILITTALAIGASAINVSLRDTQHLVELVILAWFWLSAIVYPYDLVAQRLGDWEWLSVLNPMLPVITTFQRALYNPQDAGVLPDVGMSWYAIRLVVVAVFAVILLVLALFTFGRLEEDFAEEL